MIHDEDRGFVVPTREVTVELALRGRPPQLARVFVPAGEGDSLARHAVIDLLEKDQPFLPTRGEGDRTPQLFNKDALVWVAVGSDKATAAGAEDDALFEYRHEVRVELLGGDMLVGELLYTLPPEHARVIDYLNSAGRFLRLWTADRVYLINKGFVERVFEAPLDLEGEE